MPAPVVSVVITSYNRAAYLREAIDSVLAQTFSDYELIVVDDGSTDKAPQVAREYAAKHDFIFVVEQQNAGVAAARNAGAQRARGEFVAFLDDDDICHPQRLQKQVEALRARPNCAACVTNFAPIGKTAAAAKQKSKWMWQGTGHCFRRECYLASGGYRPYFRMAEDVDFFLIFDEKYQYHFIDEVLYFYRKYETGVGDNLTNSPPLKMFPYVVAAYVSAHCRRSGQPDPLTQNTTADELLPKMAELPEDMRLRLLRITRNGGRRLLTRGEANRETMGLLCRYMDLLGGADHGDKAKKYRRWLALQCLRYGKPNLIMLFLRPLARAAS